jgi:hypothetical protein
LAAKLRDSGADKPNGAPKKPTTQDQIREFGETVEEIGSTGEQAGEAIDKIENAFDPDKK